MFELHKINLDDHLKKRGWKKGYLGMLIFVLCLLMQMVWKQENADPNANKQRWKFNKEEGFIFGCTTREIHRKTIQKA